MNRRTNSYNCLSTVFWDDKDDKRSSVPFIKDIPVSEGIRLIVTFTLLFVLDIQGIAFFLTPNDSSGRINFSYETSPSSAGLLFKPEDEGDKEPESR